MIRLSSAEEMRAWSRDCHRQGKRIGFVPTMGFLHDGHLSLVDVAARSSDVVVVSIFVNPTQFGPTEDFDSYPRNLERDLQLLEGKGVDSVYLPDRSAMYGPDYATDVEVKGLDKHLCGASRPGHFKGVATIVAKLFHAVQPDVAVFGQKDAQQAAILKRMTEDLDFGIEIVTAPIIREADGLAMSSRNVRLTPEHRRQAPALYQALCHARSAFETGERVAESLLEIVRSHLAKHATLGKIDYVELVDLANLQPVNQVQRPTLLALAVFFGGVRLIDNVELHP